MKIKRSLIRLEWILATQLGIDVRRFFRALYRFPRFVRDAFEFKSKFNGRFSLSPCLHDRDEEGGATKSDYFWQDLLIARMVFDAKPKKHVDVGSRVDGFVAHIASFREIEVLDVRPTTTAVPGVTFRQADLMTRMEDMVECCDSLTCLHALEHFGLGRYGDPLDAEGFKRGIANLASLLRDKGTLYLSVPIGVERIEFNAHRVFDPRTIIDVAANCFLEAKTLITIANEGVVAAAELSPVALERLANQEWLLGIFVFTKDASMPIATSNRQSAEA